MADIVWREKHSEILVHIARHEHEASSENIRKRFGVDALVELEEVKKAGLITEHDGTLKLTEKGIARVESLLIVAG